jgi:hypothetical protein
MPQKEAWWGRRSTEVSAEPVFSLSSPPWGFFLVSWFGVSLFRGVNMYAMLTGTLPFTVEPFSLRALYQKMVDKEMNPLPTQLSTGNVPVAPDSGFQPLCSDQLGSFMKQYLVLQQCYCDCLMTPFLPVVQMSVGFPSLSSHLRPFFFHGNSTTLTSSFCTKYITKGLSIAALIVLKLTLLQCRLGEQGL